ncbi:MAG: AAA family ATPase, partial [Lachnospiraceae bacterium]
MLKKFQVSNYKNFKEPVQIRFDKIGGYQFNSECITNDNISKMLIYGRNATGKTNLGKALMDIFVQMSGAYFYSLQKGNYLNADSDEKFATFIYEFQFKDDKVKYVYKKLSETELLDEELIINDNRIFYYNFNTKEYDFNNLSKIEADTVNVERYLQGVDVVNVQEDENQTLPFLRWIINNTALKEDSILLFLNDYINRMSMIAVGNSVLMKTKRFYDSFYKIL